MWLHLNGSGTIAHADLVTLANECFNAYITSFPGLLSLEWQLTTAILNLWDGPDVAQAISTTAAVPGGKNQDSLPANVACCISWPTSIHYRGGHPRTYLCGIAMADIQSMTRWSDELVHDIGQQADTFHQRLEGIAPVTGVTSVEHGFMSFVEDGEWRRPPVFRRIQQGAKVDKRIDTMRRRLGRDVP
jgi:hypothetical protein